MGLLGKNITYTGTPTAGQTVTLYTVPANTYLKVIFARIFQGSLNSKVQINNVGIMYVSGAVVGLDTWPPMITPASYPPFIRNEAVIYLKPGDVISLYAVSAVLHEVIISYIEQT